MDIMDLEVAMDALNMTAQENKEAIGKESHKFFTVLCKIYSIVAVFMKWKCYLYSVKIK